jgi:CRISPR/Cas system endoribonuclease Cas6 (RAMP superfamily)
MSYVKDGRYSFLDFHRRAQALILSELDEARIWKNDGTRFEKADIIDLQEFKEWSTFKTLALIFYDLSDKNGDKFESKFTDYASKASKAMSRAAMRLNFNGNTEQEPGEVLDNFSIPALRR